MSHNTNFPFMSDFGEEFVPTKITEHVLSADQVQFSAMLNLTTLF